MAAAMPTGCPHCKGCFADVLGRADTKMFEAGAPVIYREVMLRWGCDPRRWQLSSLRLDAPAMVQVAIAVSFFSQSLRIAQQHFPLFDMPAFAGALKEVDLFVRRANEVAIALHADKPIDDREVADWYREQGVNIPTEEQRAELRKATEGVA